MRSSPGRLVARTCRTRRVRFPGAVSSGACGPRAGRPAADYPDDIRILWRWRGTAGIDRGPLQGQEAEAILDLDDDPGVLDRALVRDDSCRTTVTVIR